MVSCLRSAVLGARERSSDTDDSTQNPVTVLHEIDLEVHHLFILNGQSTGLQADEQTPCIADNNLGQYASETCRLLISLQEFFK